MTKIIVIRLHPAEPTTPDEFTKYLKDLKITAFYPSFAGSKELFQIGEPAEYLPEDPAQNRIFQHINEKDSTKNSLIKMPTAHGWFGIPTSSKVFELGVIATAVIDVSGYKEYGTSDVFLEIKRGETVIDSRQLDYNVIEYEIRNDILQNPVANVDPNDPAFQGYFIYISNFIGLEPPSLYVALPAPWDDGDSAYMQIPSDGSPVRFDGLKTAVELVLSKHDPTANISKLSAAEARHIAYEIVYNREMEPLPNRKNTVMEAMYSGPAPAADPRKDDDPNEKERKKFEAELVSYYSTHNVKAERLAGFIFSLSAAIFCEDQSKQAQSVGFEFPVILPPVDSSSKIKDARVILQVQAISAEFKVPAEYFYALGAIMPIDIAAEQRYQMAVLGKEKQNLNEFKNALESRIISLGDINPDQAARRLHALGAIGKDALAVQVKDGTELQILIKSWLGFAKSDWTFWSDLSYYDKKGHLELVLCVVTGCHEPLMAKFKGMPFPDVRAFIDYLSEQKVEDWKELFIDNKGNPLSANSEILLPPFTMPGTPEERVAAFIRHLRKFFDINPAIKYPASPDANVPPIFDPSHSPIRRFIDKYLELYNESNAFKNWNKDQVEKAVADIALEGSYDPSAIEWLNRSLITIHELYYLTDLLDIGSSLQFSLMEALYARGFDSIASVKSLTLSDFQEALKGTVAFDRAEAIHELSKRDAKDNEGEHIFHPINPDGSLANCIPPSHLSPLGPVAYLQEMLELSEKSTCEDTPDSIPDISGIKDKIASRRGPLHELHVTKANLEIPLPLIDLVNECLEALAINPAAEGTVYGGAVYDTTQEEELGSHKLNKDGRELAAEDDQGTFLHDSETLLLALPEHSSPATPGEGSSAYDNLKRDFSSPLLPYSQPLDISRSYLGELGTSRYAVMRRFRKDITELVLDPDPLKEPPGFQRHLWRYPVRIDIALEYLHITPEEYNQLFTHDIVLDETDGRVLYGFDSDAEDNWINTVIRLPEFLRRTGLAYCEFLELWKSKFVTFYSNSDALKRKFPECEPCCLEDLQIRLLNPNKPYLSLKPLAVFIRLWRKLQGVKGAQYSFRQLKDICDVFQLFSVDGKINPDFIRQLAAFQMLRDHFGLALVDKKDPGTGSDTGANRMHLLSLWAPWDKGEPKGEPRKWWWAVDELLDRIQHYAKERHYATAKHKFHPRPPEFIKLLQDNLGPLSRLAGFDPNSSMDNWHSLPTHTLRFAEVLSKIYASKFGIGEILYLFTADKHLDGDDPFALQTRNEALDMPLDLPDDARDHSLWNLRKKLLEVDVPQEEAFSWSWERIKSSLQDEFDLPPDNIISLGEHFFPEILESTGHTVEAKKRQYRSSLKKEPVSLPPVSSSMWNTPSHGPFRYDEASKKLWTELPLKDEAVFIKLSRIKQLNEAEQKAVREIYFLPRIDLACFDFIFANFTEAESYLIQEEDEAKRWSYFQREFALFYARCQIIAEHLAGHVVAATGQSSSEGNGLAWCLLKHLLADENKAMASWEDDDSGIVSDFTWTPKPKGGAFAALLGLTGTGLLCEFMAEGDVKFAWEDDKLIWEDNSTAWRESSGQVNEFSQEKNAWNSPIPTIIPSMGLKLSLDQERFAGIRNGFALLNPQGRPLNGAQGFAVRWKGILLIEKEGMYEFFAGAPTPEGEKPDFESAEHKRWHVTLGRGQKKWVLLSHRWPDERAPHVHSSLNLSPGAYQILVEYVQPAPRFSKPEEIHPQHTGFQLKYSGPDNSERLETIPSYKLFRDFKDETLADGIESLEGTAKQLLEQRFTSTLRDMRRTYQRAFKALLFAHRFGLSAKPASDDGQSEMGYILAHSDEFAGTSYHRNNSGFNTHKASFDFNLLPLLDNYHHPTAAKDQRVKPSEKRQQALFDWWERIFDYTIIRREAQAAPEYPVWLLFHEAAENHPDNPAHLLRHMGVDLSHSALVLQYFLDPNKIKKLESDELEDERWAERAWMAEKWIRGLLGHFYEKDIREARPDLWASNDPIVPLSGESQAGNENLTKFFRDGCIENGEPRRYEEIKKLNDGLRERARRALLAYLCGMKRVKLPWSESAENQYAENPKHLSELLLMDVEAGICERASRIEEAISAVQICIQRCRLGLENDTIPKFSISPEFIALWEGRFASFRIWEACKRRELYRENWIDWDELQKARQTEAFQFFESELRRATLTIPVPGGLEYWPDMKPPAHPGLWMLQKREPSSMKQLENSIQGFDVLGTPQRHARPSWLADVGAESQINDYYSRLNYERILDESENLPFWLKSAIRLGTKFIRIAAAGMPPASTSLGPRRQEPDSGCCVLCGQIHSPVIDEYYIWLTDSSDYTEPEPNESEPYQEAEWGWHDKEKLPSLLSWKSKRMVHLAWCRIHNGVFQQPRRSDEGIGVNEDSEPELEFLGRLDDSLNFEVINGKVPSGYEKSKIPGFRYDLATDAVEVVLSLIQASSDNQARERDAIRGRVAIQSRALPVYPYFVHYSPGARLIPPSIFGPAISAASWLRSHCHYESALKWYDLAFNPLNEDCQIWPLCPLAPTDGTDRVRFEAIQSYDENAWIRNRSIILHYLETLLQWGDAMMRRNSPEAFQQAELIFDTASKILGARPHSIMVSEGAKEDADTVWTFQPSSPPLNPRLLGLYESIEDRRALIHACHNARRLRNGRPNKDMPFWGTLPGYVDGRIKDSVCHSWQAAARTCPDDDWCCLHSPYRFIFLSQKAQEIANEVRGLGGALLAAFEKGDAEFLSSLRSGHERQLLTLAQSIRENQWREADWQVQALRKTKEGAQTRQRYYDGLIQRGLISGETEYQTQTGVSVASRTAGNVSEGTAQFMNITPDMFVGFPCSFTQLPIGTKLSKVFSAIARIANTLADIAGTKASRRLTEGGWDRREEEWRHQSEVIGIEIEQIERQILAAERRRDIALRELNNHQQQVENAIEVQDFLRDKFTNHELYLWLQQETAALHYQMYELALHTARQAQRAFNYERGYTKQIFVPSEAWDNLREGLMAGERLQHSLRRMEKTYLDRNIREYELTKHISLRLHFPLAFLSLQATGYCEIEIPEWMFDLDYPGQFMRRIKNVTLTIPCVVGPYTGVHCRLTLLSSITRVDPRLSIPPATCCSNDKLHDGYSPLPNDPRIVKQYAAKEAIATSSGQNDSGMFELSFRDERYLPFEFAGAISRWRLEMPIENNNFDFDTLSDVILHLNYTSREGGDTLRNSANKIAQKHLPGSGVRYFDIKCEFSDAWQLFQACSEDKRSTNEFDLRLSRAMFPYLAGKKDICINRLELFFEAKGAKPSAHQIVKFIVHRNGNDKYNHKHNIYCIADAEWPDLYHGSLDVNLGPMTEDEYCSLGKFRFADHIGKISHAFLFCGYIAGSLHSSERAFSYIEPEIKPGDDR